MERITHKTIIKSASIPNSCCIYPYFYFTRVCFFFFTTVLSSKFLASYHPISFAIHRYKWFRYKFTITITYLTKLTVIPWDHVSQSLSNFSNWLKSVFLQLIGLNRIIGTHTVDFMSIRSLLTWRMSFIYLFFFFLLSCY